MTIDSSCLDTQALFHELFTLRASDLHLKSNAMKIARRIYLRESMISVRRLVRMRQMDDMRVLGLATTSISPYLVFTMPPQPQLDLEAADLMDLPHGKGPITTRNVSFEDWHVGIRDSPFSGFFVLVLLLSRRRCSCSNPVFRIRSRAPFH